MSGRLKVSPEGVELLATEELPDTGRDIAIFYSFAYPGQGFKPPTGIKEQFFSLEMIIFQHFFLTFPRIIQWICKG